jgi:SAM-dependent methyltransferase
MSFDAVAPTYDGSFGLSPSGRLFRFRLAERVVEAAPAPRRVLDVGCGTGEDAIWLAGNGYDVLGIDASAGMIEVASAKARTSSSSATFERISLAEFGSRGQTFDVVISNFGALNCVPLADWARLVPALLTSGGRAFVSVMGQRPEPEAWRDRSEASPRGANTSVEIGGSPMTVHYDTVGDIISALEPYAAVERVEALGCLVPGPQYQDFGRRHPIGVGLLAMGEALVRTWPVVRGRGDHTLVEFRRR